MKNKKIPGGRKPKKFYIIFRFGESPNGELVYSTCNAKFKIDAIEKACSKYGNYPIFDAWTETKFKNSTIKKLGATFYEDITSHKTRKWPNLCEVSK